MIHEFFYFLGTNSGELLKRSIEFVLFTIVTYMIVSEWTRSKKYEYKYLITAFASLALQRGITSLIYLNVVFGELRLITLESFLPVLDHGFELFALILLANAFLYPYFEKKVGEFKYSIKSQVMLLILITIIIEIFWYVKIIKEPLSLFIQYKGNLVFVILQIVVLAYPIFKITSKEVGPFKEYRYKRNVVIAFFVYLVSPVLHLINILFYDNFFAQLTLVSHPFPFIAVLLFTRIIYLKLVDKASLLDELELTEKKYKEVKEISELKDEFVSLVSHELRTPLTSMKLYVSLLKQGELGRTTKKQAEALDVIKDESDRLSNLINDVLDLSKLEAKKIKLRITTIDLNEIIGDSMYYNYAKEKGVKVINKVPRRFIVNIDKDRFKQVFVNLLGNAVKFTDKSGKITISAKDSKNHWEMSIADTGKGIEKDKIPRLFERFYQAEDFMTRTKGGTGLGLAIAKKIVDLHGGDINVKSEVGKGSVFTVVMVK